MVKNTGGGGVFQWMVYAVVIAKRAIRVPKRVAIN